MVMKNYVNTYHQYSSPILITSFHHQYQAAVRPPSRIRIWPVTYEAAGLAR